ncbi:substrate-binding domain-containing protein [Roseisalinus antarcticus]|uniref:substrate-binding domain-containing protein n=1 Tax=Roseisalinus antarcticus TaxID=254357 RepID=UPI0013566153|nr:substrate-binding domain-containing protein [Roseisalinus antarcticus]
MTDVQVIAPVAIRVLLTELVEGIGRETGLDVGLTFDLNPAVARRITAGEAFDLAITNPWHVAELVAAGLARADSETAFWTIPLAIAAREMREAAAPEDILRQATSVAYTAEGTSGQTFLRVAEKLGVLNAIRPRLMPMGAGEPVRAVAAGEAEIAIAPLTTILAAPGVVGLAEFDRSLGASIDLSMVLCGDAPALGAEALLAALADPALDAALAAGGMARGPR